MKPMGAFARYAAHVLGGGYSPVPLKPENGLPAIKGWDQLRTKAMSTASIEELVRKNPHLSLAIAGGFNGFVPIDVDTNDPAVIDAAAAVLPEPVVARLGSKGFVAFYCDPTGTIGGRKFPPPPPNPKPLVEVLATGVITIPPSPHRKTGQPYRWLTRATLLNTRVTELSVITPAHIEELAKALARWCPPKPVFVQRVVDSSILVNDRRRLAYARRVLETELAKLITLTGGRNWALFQAACRVGKHVHYGFITEAEVVNSLMAACDANGYVDAPLGGRKQALDTIKSGLKKSSGDALPGLANRVRSPKTKNTDAGAEQHAQGASR